MCTPTSYVPATEADRSRCKLVASKEQTLRAQSLTITRSLRHFFTEHQALLSLPTVVKELAVQRVIEISRRRRIYGEDALVLQVSPIRELAARDRPRLTRATVERGQTVQHL